jgi:hypothetical protein
MIPRQPAAVSAQAEAPQGTDAVLTPSVVRSASSYSGANVADRLVTQQEEKENESPLASFKLGDALTNTAVAHIRKTICKLHVDSFQLVRPER